MATKCVHKGCGKLFSDPEENCVHHPGPPIFHEGQKGWKCCKPRVLTFDEFLSIPPCTTGKHSTVDDTPAPAPTPPQNPPADDAAPASAPKSSPTTTNGVAPTPPAPTPRLPQASLPPAPSPAPESESDDPDLDLDIPAGTTCRRRGCNATYSPTPNIARTAEQCVHHPGQALFHEGSKGWTCCKRRVLEFDEFLKIEGCRTKTRHRFVASKEGGKKKGERVGGGEGKQEEERVESVRHDFYQTAVSVIASFYLKGIERDTARVEFEGRSVGLDLRTEDGRRYQETVPLFGGIDAEKSAFKVMGTKLELSLVKGDGGSWPVLRSDERGSGEIIQVGRPERA